MLLYLTPPKLRYAVTILTNFKANSTDLNLLKEAKKKNH